MLDFLHGLVSGLTTREMLLGAVDVILVAYLIYRVLLMIRGTRAAQMIAGIMLIGVAYFASTRFELGTLGWLLDNFLQYFIILIIVVFQDDIRRGLMRMGRRMFMARRMREEVYLVEEVVRAVERMARLRVGALVVFERLASIDEFIQPGTVLDAKVSRELIWSVFRVDAENPVHDGAIIIRNLRIYQAGALLPLTQDTEVERRLGTRHRAAIGITEETDAVVVVVSEERGSISVCHQGRIVQNVDADNLRATLLDVFRRTKPSERSLAAVEKTSPPATSEGETVTVREAGAEASAQQGSKG